MRTITKKIKQGEFTRVIGYNLCPHYGGKLYFSLLTKHPEKY